MRNNTDESIGISDIDSDYYEKALPDDIKQRGINKPVLFETPKQLKGADYVDEDLKYKQMLEQQKEEHRQEVLHIETIGMMAKYQLVFIKLETNLVRVAHICKMRHQKFKTNAFKAIQNFSQMKSASQKLKTHLVYSTLQNKMQQLNNVLIKIRQRTLTKAFSNIYMMLEMKKAFGRNKTELKKQKEEFAQALKLKNQEMASINKKFQTTQEANQALAIKEAEYIKKLKNMEKMIANYENEQLENNKVSRKGSENEKDSKKLRSLEQKVKELEVENNDLRDKLCSTENNVSLFIKEMSDLLDSHELSTNPGSEENFSLNNSYPANYEINLDEEPEQNSYSKVREKFNQMANYGLMNNYGLSKHSTKEARPGSKKVVQQK